MSGLRSGDRNCLTGSKPWYPQRSLGEAHSGDDILYEFRNPLLEHELYACSIPSFADSPF